MEKKQDDNKDDAINEMMSEEGEGDAMAEGFVDDYNGPFTQPYPEASNASPTKDNDEYTESDDERDSAILFSQMSESERLLPLALYAKLFYQRFDELRKNRKLNQGNDESEVGALFSNVSTGNQTVVMRQALRGTTRGQNIVGEHILSVKNDVLKILSQQKVYVYLAKATFGSLAITKDELKQCEVGVFDIAGPSMFRQRNQMYIFSLTQLTIFHLGKRIGHLQMEDEPLSQRLKACQSLYTDAVHVLQLGLKMTYISYMRTMPPGRKILQWCEAAIESGARRLFSALVYVSYYIIPFDVQLNSTNEIEILPFHANIRGLTPEGRCVAILAQTKNEVEEFMAKPRQNFWYNLAHRCHEYQFEESEKIVYNVIRKTYYQTKEE